ncbi:NAD kinase 2, chloroplastic-like isoform X2 [Gossypium arboreum]|uniref:NAD kinase 2, chloroplastic-like isoform X2 n=1 Tax=Gossypium arboreum TaxID=29729 RepID=UPI0022F1760B|nr:NAD kinase 2, chloroplastic-like isoform X2 [Gossypium arboreum]XP_052883518.1 NAD kinase 2, chloroplastic-like isoform X2 [Gossypium arboreum]
MESVRLALKVKAELSKSFSVNLGLDSQTAQSHDVSQLRWIGPVPGDIAEVEAYCRIFRAAERLHTALMETLCNPLTGECSVSYDFTPEEKPVAEDKIVSVLGCMLSLLNKGREDVLSGRVSVMNTFRMADMRVMEDKLPPLALFRSEMKRCCESLHVALENYLTPDDYRSLNVWRKLQRLKNACYDLGFPRKDNHPCHTLFANWQSVCWSTSKEEVESKDCEIEFWRGGQVTEEGLKWLIDKGFKTIVDLRAETVKDNFYQSALDDAILSGKVEFVKIPVEVGTAPSMEQVEKFASLVSDCNKKPVYLHSKEGVWRTSAMVSRWQQYMTRFASVSNQSASPSDALSLDANGLGTLRPSSSKEEKFKLQETNKLLEESSILICSSNGEHLEGAFSDSDKEDHRICEANNDPIPSQVMTSGEAVDNENGSKINIYQNANPLQAQFPPCNVFSRKEMSKFLRSKKISPPMHFNRQLKRLEIQPVSGEISIGGTWGSEVVHANAKSGLVETESSNGVFSAKNQAQENKNLAAANEKRMNGTSYASSSLNVNGFVEGERYSMTETKVATLDSSSDGHVTSNSLSKIQKSNGNASSYSSDDELVSIEGNMCASATGVVRVQSRKKAEMFLVRTDGFSCAREKVTESSLAFTHPSTQQQMLMWKSTPKTVLLLKKLGPELMKEAKEVASFLYYQEKMNVLVEPEVHDIFARIPGFGFVQTFYTQDTSDLHERVDFVACLGGDGVILHASNLFRGAVPPVVSFNLGSLGFLTSHTFEDYRQDLKQVIHGNNTAEGVYITLRMRLRCEIFRNGKAVPGKIFDVLNEVVVDRGSNPYLSKIECYEHDRLITKVQGDGVIVATPTGSTAYSTAAGGSMVHPNVPCMLFTPICPHSLSFRPVILPDSARLELKIPDDARSNAWVSFDGKRRQQLSRGHSVRISMSQHPLPTVNKCDQTGDWFHSLIRCLNWNERMDQKAL